MTRSILLGMVLVLPSLATSGAAHDAKAQDKPRCEAPESAGDRRDVTCSFSAAATPRRLRFQANFSGGHDDTMAAMTATLDGVALACSAGSKTELMGEDGDVSLRCQFTLAGTAGTLHVLKVALSWRHAQYTGFEFGPD